MFGGFDGNQKESQPFQSKVGSLELNLSRLGKVAHLGEAHDAFPRLSRVLSEEVALIQWFPRDGPISQVALRSPAKSE